MDPIILGFVFILIGAICGGSFGLPSKFVKKDTPWEVLWGPFFFFVAVLIPGVVAPLVVKDLGGVYRAAEAASPGTIVNMLIFGFLWGLGSMTLGKAFAFIGLSLAYALNYGAQIVTGAIVPMAIHHPEYMTQPHGLVVIAGVAVCVVGVVIAGRAAILKERGTKSDDAVTSESDAKSSKMLIGLIIGVASGVLCACWAVASGFAGPVNDAAGANNPDWASSWAFTALILWGGALSACGYCVWELTKNKTWGQLKAPGIAKTLALALAMAILHDAAVLFFGLGWINIGTELAVSVGYAAFMSFAIIVGNFHGFRTGEWKGASPQSVKLIIIGIVVLVAGVCILAKGNAMTPTPPAPTPTTLPTPATLPSITP
jgi:L-rhamnose-H+ transport protein